MTKRKNKYTGDPDVKPIIDAQFRDNEMTYVIRNQQREIKVHKALLEEYQSIITIQGWVIFVLLSLLIVALLFV